MQRVLQRVCGEFFFRNEFDASFWPLPPTKSGPRATPPFVATNLRLIDAVPSRVAWNVVALHRHRLGGGFPDEANDRWIPMEAIASPIRNGLSRHNP